MLSNGEVMGYGCCVWSTGNASRPLVEHLVEQLPAQQEFANKRRNAAKLAVDPYMRIIGAFKHFLTAQSSVIHGII